MISGLKDISPAGRSALQTGAGFALGFGWLWFPALQDWWLPLFLWGTPWSGGGVSLFYCLLALGFFGWGLYGGRRKPNGTNEHAPCTENGAAEAATSFDYRLGRLPHWAHGLTLVFMGVALAPSFFAPLRLSGAWLYLPVVCMALAGLVQGVFWSGALLALPARYAVSAYVAGLLTAALFSALCSMVDGRMCGVLLFLAILGAWQSSLTLRRTLRRMSPEPKKGRGRPPKQREDADPVPCRDGARPDATTWSLFACSIAFFLLALGQATPGQGAFLLSPWMAGLLPLLGAGVVLLLENAVPSVPGNPGNGCAATCADGEAEGGPPWLKRLLRRVSVGHLPPSTILAFAIAFWGLALLVARTWSPSVWLAGGLLEGCVCAAAIVLLSDSLQLPSGGSLSVRQPANAWSRASLALGAVLVLGILGAAGGRGLFSLSGKWSGSLLPGSETGILAGLLSPSGLAGFLSLLATFLTLLCMGRAKRLAKKSSIAAGREDEPAMAVCAEAQQVPIPVDAPMDAKPVPTFTDREMEILNQLRQGLSNRQIAAALDIQEGTVRFHLRNMYQKAGVRERNQLKDLS